MELMDVVGYTFLLFTFCSTKKFRRWRDKQFNDDSDWPVTRNNIRNTKNLKICTLWPTSCLIQQTMAGKTIENYDWVQALRFSLYGGLFTAPTLYAWIRVSTKLWPVTSLKTSITKAVVEQLTYGPAALVCFFFGMSLLEGKSIEEAKKQTETKFYPTWKVGVCFWPILQTINFHYIPEHNRVPFVSACSLVWCCFLAYMQEMSLKRAHHLKIRDQILGTSS